MSSTTITSKEASQVTRIAHTARCKLHISASQPDRNLRFILGHAFTLDNLILRIAEIEVSDTSSDEEDEGLTEMVGDGDGGRRVSFSGRLKGAMGSKGSSRKSPPPPPMLVESGSDDEGSEDGEDDEDEDDDGLGLTRFASASGHVRGVGGVDEGIGLSEEELRVVCVGDGDEELKGLYDHVAGCRCHGVEGPVVERFWEVKGEKIGEGRRAVVQVVG